MPDTTGSNITNYISAAVDKTRLSRGSLSGASGGINLINSYDGGRGTRRIVHCTNRSICHFYGERIMTS